MKNFLAPFYKVSLDRIILLIFLVFIFIFADIICENFIGIIYNQQATNSFILFLIFILLEIFFAPIQAALSDRYGRRKSLIISLFFSLLSLGLVYQFNKNSDCFYLLILATIAKGAFGNTLPIALAIIADTKHKNYRLLFAFSTAAYAGAYLMLASASNNPNYSNIEINQVLLFLFVLTIIFCSFLFSRADQEAETLKGARSVFFLVRDETRLLAKDINHIPTRKALAAFFFWELSLYIILVSQIDFQINKTARVAETMMWGYLIGVVLLIFCYKFKDKTVIKAGYYISFFSLVPYFILYKIVTDQASVLRICYFFHALGNALLSPSLLSILAKERNANEHGRIYGLTDSVDTIGYLCAALAIIVLKKLNLQIMYLIIFSFVSFGVSWLFFKRFQDAEE